jgi:hypothetical protein
MDIHAPTEPIHTKKDFFIHLFTITIGLLIALSLEGLVEYIHHRHLVAEARANIRLELEQNHTAAQGDLSLLQKNIDLQQSNIQAIHKLQAHTKDFHGSVVNTMSFNAIEDAAWRTARDTGALSFMPYDEVQRYSDLYMLSDIVNNQAVTTGTADFTAAAPFKMGFDADTLPPEEYIRLLHDNAAVEIDLTTLKQFVQQLDAMTVEELKK